MTREGTVNYTNKYSKTNASNTGKLDSRIKEQEYLKLKDNIIFK